MRCRWCGREVLLAERCPYCRRPTGIPAAARPEGQPPEAEVSGRFVGPLRAGEAGAWGGGAGRPPGAAGRRLSLWEFVRRLAAFLRDPGVPGWKRALLAAALVYVLVPLDLLPSPLLPGLGWLDDLAVLWLLFSRLERELAGYVPPEQRLD